MLSEIEKNRKEKKIFFFPSYPRVFKNFEIICEASKILIEEGIDDFEVILTIDGTENKYSKYVFNKYKNIDLIGLQSREKVFEYYQKSSCLIFPSKLETWGLPITEYKEFNKPILLANLDYAKETIGDYNQVLFFNPEDSQELKIQMKKIITETAIFEKTYQKKIKEPFVQSWTELFDMILNSYFI